MSEKGPRGIHPSFEEWRRRKQEEEERERRKPVRPRRAKGHANRKAEDAISRAAARRRKDTKDAPSSEEIVFGQAFYPNDDQSESLFVVTDTSPRYYPESIGAAQVVITDSGIERLGLPGDISPKEVGQVKEIWSVDRIIKAMGMVFNGNLPADMQELLRENAAKTPRKIT